MENIENLQNKIRKLENNLRALYRNVFLYGCIKYTKDRHTTPQGLYI